MRMLARLLAFLRVPPAPSAPAGDRDVQVFRAAPNFLRYKLVLWVLKNVGALAGLIVGLGFLRGMPNWWEFVDIGGLAIPLSGVFRLIEAGAVVGFVAQAVWSLALLRLDFDQRWYIVSDRSLRIREGIVRLHEKTMTFANIQQVTIDQGPLQRLLGIADLEVRTAGGGGGGKQTGEATRTKHDLHVAYFRGVANAVAIRDTIRQRLRNYAGAGLGDPEDDRTEVAPARAGASRADSLHDAAHALVEEARALRKLAPAIARGAGLPPAS